jgi:hypothetical protein
MERTTIEDNAVHAWNSKLTSSEDKEWIYGRSTLGNCFGRQINQLFIIKKLKVINIGRFMLHW